MIEAEVENQANQIEANLEAWADEIDRAEAYNWPDGVKRSASHHLHGIHPAVLECLSKRWSGEVTWNQRGMNRACGMIPHRVGSLHLTLFTTEVKGAWDKKFVLEED